MDSSALVSLVNSFLDPALTALMIIIPTACLVYCAVQALKWYASDEQTQQQSPIWQKIKRAVLLAVVMFSLSAILKIFGISR